MRHPILSHDKDLSGCLSLFCSKTATSPKTTSASKACCMRPNWEVRHHSSLPFPLFQGGSFVSHDDTASGIQHSFHSPFSVVLKMSAHSASQHVQKFAVRPIQVGQPSFCDHAPLITSLVVHLSFQQDLSWFEPHSFLPLVNVFQVHLCQ